MDSKTHSPARGFYFMITLKLTRTEAKGLDLLLDRTPHKDTSQSIAHNKLIQALGTETHLTTRLEPNIYLSPAGVELILRLIEFVEQCDYKAPEQLKPLKEKIEVLQPR